MHCENCMNRIAYKSLRLISDGRSYHPRCSRPDTELWWLVSPPSDSCMYDYTQTPKSISPPTLLSAHTLTGEYLPALRMNGVDMTQSIIHKKSPGQNISFFFCGLIGKVADGWHVLLTDLDYYASETKNISFDSTWEFILYIILNYKMYTLYHLSQ